MNSKRVERIIEKMKSFNIKQQLITDPASIFYLTGKWIHPGERLLALYLNIEGSPKLFVNELFPIDDGLKVDILWHKDTDDAIKLLSNNIEDGGILGIDKNWSSGFLLALMKLKASCQYINASFIVDALRMIKDETEIQLMRNASQLNDEAVSKLIKYLTPGITEKQAASQLLNIYEQLGVDGISFSPIIAFGKNAADPHHVPGNTVLKEGDSVIIDIGCVKDSYSSDMTRTVFCNSVSCEAQKVYEIVKAANEKAISLVKPGVKFKDIDAAARSYIEEMGYGKYFSHRTGHSIGIEVHEAGDVSATNEDLLAEGMIFSVEPGIYLTGNLGVRIEDLVLVTKDGFEVLNKLSKELIVI